MALPRFRAATPKEVEKIKAKADLGPSTQVLALDNEGGEPDIVVLRTAVEVDPVFYSNASNHRRRAVVVSLIENMLAFTGVPAYYFNIPASDEFADYREIATKWGAEQTSTQPEYRYKKSLI